MSDTGAGAILESIKHYAVLAVDAGGTIRSANAGATTVLGWPAAELIGQPLSVVYPPSDSADALAVLSRAAEGFQPEQRSLRRRDGREFTAEVAGAPLPNPTAEAASMFSVVIRDASATEKAEQALARATDELSRFAFTVSHDLQEPLRGVRAYAELLQRRYKGRLDADADEFIQYMIDGVNRMNQLLKDILAYSQAGREDRTRPEITDANAVIQWALMNVDPAVKESGGKITYDPLPRVWADQTQLATLFQQLLLNSIKFRSTEPPEIFVSARQVDDFYEFSVRDNGIGVDPQHTERIFGIFKRLHGREVPGTGIGLSICRKIVDALGGRIWMESEEGKGATVRFTLPTHG